MRFQVGEQNAHGTSSTASSLSQVPRVTEVLPRGSLSYSITWASFRHARRRLQGQWTMGRPLGRHCLEHAGSRRTAEGRRLVDVEDAIRYGMTTALLRESSHRVHPAPELAVVCTDAAVELPLSSALASAKSCRRTPIAQCETSRSTPFAQLLKSIETSPLLPSPPFLLPLRSTTSQRTPNSR